MARTLVLHCMMRLLTRRAAVFKRHASRLCITSFASRGVCFIVAGGLHFYCPRNATSHISRDHCRLAISVSYVVCTLADRCLQVWSLGQLPGPVLKGDDPWYRPTLLLSHCCCCLCCSCNHSSSRLMKVTPDGHGKQRGGKVRSSHNQMRFSPAEKTQKPSDSLILTAGQHHMASSHKRRDMALSMGQKKGNHHRSTD